eukprot:COSAG02_NODE_5337_length_4424_cov_4.315376_4_plen_85_part_00
MQSSGSHGHGRHFRGGDMYEAGEPGGSGMYRAHKPGGSGMYRAQPGGGSMYAQISTKTSLIFARAYRTYTFAAWFPNSETNRMQ